MKTIIIISLISVVFSSLKFQLTTKKPRCYIEELFENSVAMIKWKISNLPEDEEIKKCKSY